MDILSQIYKYYPAGIDEVDPRYAEFEGIKLLTKIVSEKNNSELGKKWQAFLNFIGTRETLNIELYPNHVLPCFAANILLRKESMPMLEYSRSVRVYISALAPCFAIIAADTIYIEEVGAEMTPLYYVSPHGFYSQWFKEILSAIRDLLPEYHYLSFAVLRERVPNVHVSGAHNEEDEDSTIFQALFTGENISHAPFIGDQYYE